MKNKVLIGVLALMMLIAFTACDTQAGYKLPVGMTATASKTQYLKGETIDPTTIVATVQFSDGSSQDLDGSKLGVAAATITADTKVDLEYGVGANAVSSSVQLYVGTVKEITLGNLPTEAAADGSIDDSAMTATVIDSFGNTRTLNAGDFEVTAKAETSGTDKGKVTVSTVKVFDQEVTTIKGTTGWKVTVATATTPEEEFDATKAYSYYFVVLDGTTPVDGAELNGTPFTFDEQYVGESFSWQIWKVNTENNAHAVATSSDYYVVSGTAPANSFTLTVKPTAQGSETVPENFASFAVVCKGNAGYTAKTTINIAYGNDYIDTFKTIELPSASDGSVIGNWVFTATMKSGASKTVVNGTDFTAVMLDDWTTLEEGKKANFLIEYGMKAEGKWLKSATIPSTTEKAAD